MVATYPIAEAQQRLPEIFREAKQHLVRIMDGETVAGYMIAPQSVAAMEAEIETAEITSNPRAMSALADAQAGRTCYLPLSALDDDGEG